MLAISAFLTQHRPSPTSRRACYPASSAWRSPPFPSTPTATIRIEAIRKLVWRGGINLYAKSPFFGGYSALIIGPSGKSLLAISDAGTWLRAKFDYDGRKLKGLSGASIGPILGRDGKPLAGDARAGPGRLGAHRRRHVEGHGLRRLRAQPSRPALSFHLRPLRPPDGGLTLPAETKRMSANRGIEAIVPIRVGRLKGTTVLFSERLPDKNGNLRGWLIGGRPGRDSPQERRRLRHYRRRGAAGRRHSRARAPLSLQRGGEDAHPPHRREGLEARSAHLW